MRCYLRVEYHNAFGRPEDWPAVIIIASDRARKRGPIMLSLKITGKSGLYKVHGAKVLISTQGLVGKPLARNYWIMNKQEEDYRPQNGGN